ncbi:hypothetical protein BH10PSE7_BH10PSE7_19420 [soil metagenome]
MPQPLSNDLSARVVAFVEAGHSRHEAAAHFRTSVSFAVNLMRLWRDTGSVEPRPRGGFRHGKLGPHKDFILATVAARSDITMAELAGELAKARNVKVDPSRLLKFLMAPSGASTSLRPPRLRIVMGTRTVTVLSADAGAVAFALSFMPPSSRCAKVHLPVL